VRQGGQRRACKLIEKEPLRQRGMLEQLRHEVQIHTALKHRHVLEVLDQADTPTHVYLVLELGKWTLLQWAQSFPKHQVPERECLPVLAQAARAVQFLHDSGFVHRDLTLANLMLAPDASDELVVKVTDFGWACQKDSVPQQPCGTVEFWAPEIVSVAMGVYAGQLPETQIGAEVDLWALGVGLYQLLCGAAPFPAPQGPTPAFVCAVCMQCYLPPPGVLSECTTGMLKSLLVRKEQRSSIEDLVLRLQCFVEQPVTPRRACPLGPAPELDVRPLRRPVRSSSRRGDLL